MKRIQNKTEVAAGSLVAYEWGATMRRIEFYQVVKVDRSRVYLGRPEVHTEGNQEGHTWIVAPCLSSEIVRHAKFTRSGLKLCGRPNEVDWRGKDIAWESGDSYWSYLKHAEIGKKEHFYGD